MCFSDHACRHEIALSSLDHGETDRWVAMVAKACDGRTVFVGGNGGSAAQASHFVGELVGAYRDRGRRPIAAACLNQELSVVTAVANDFGYEHVMERELLANARPGDVFLGLTTSGRSPNIMLAVDAARRIGAEYFVLSNGLPETVLDRDRWLVVGAPDTPSAQEVHIMVLHYLAEVVEAMCRR